jgi:hypothetical protein
MPTINQLPVLSTISSGDQLPVYSPNNGDARRTSIGSLLTFFQQSFASPTLSVNLYVPGNGFNITVPTPVSNDQWMLLQPAGTLATGTITLPLNTGVPDGTTVLITSTQEITSLTIALNGASALYGGVSFLGAGSATAIRFYQPTNSWYQINAETVFAAGVQAFLTNPTSANLRAAMTDETGTGLLVFNTSPTLVTPILGTVASGNISACTSTSMVLVTPILGTPTSGTLTNCTGLPIATGVSGLAANVATFLATPSSANLAAALTDETGTGANVFATSPTLATPIITNPTVSTGTFTSPALVTPAIGVATGTSLTATGTLVSSGTAGVGYSTGAGGVVTQGVSRTTGVTLDKTTGAITLFSAAGTTVATTFTVTNSTVAATDVIILNQKSGTDLYDLMVTAVAAGSFNLTFRTTGGTTTETPVFNFAVIKGVAA